MFDGTSLEGKSWKVFNPWNLDAYINATAFTMEIEGGEFSPFGVGVGGAGVGCGDGGT